MSNSRTPPSHNSTNRTNVPAAGPYLTARVRSRVVMAGMRGLGMATRVARRPHWTDVLSIRQCSCDRRSSACDVHIDQCQPFVGEPHTVVQEVKTAECPENPRTQH